jgi:hypothetical protein
MASEQGPHLPALSHHEDEALARGQRAQIVEFEFYLEILSGVLDEEDSSRNSSAFHGIIIL